jgi:hypothetical protein
MDINMHLNKYHRAEIYSKIEAAFIQHVTFLLPFLVFAETILRQSKRLNLANTKGFSQI